MLKMMTFFQGLPGQQPMPGALDFPGGPQKLPSTSEAESEASMSEASSEDLVPPLEAEVAPDRDEDEAVKKKEKKKSKGLANVFSVFTKGRKKKGQPSSADTEGESEPQARLAGRLPTGRPGPQVRVARGWAGQRSIGVDAPLTQHAQRAGKVGVHLHPLILGAGSGPREVSPAWDTPLLLGRLTSTFWGSPPPLLWARGR
nr:tumor necrosis factor alpha-induced protein 2-like [Vicugna pacos]